MPALSSPVFFFSHETRFLNVNRHFAFPTWKHSYNSLDIAKYLRWMFGRILLACDKQIRKQNKYKYNTFHSIYQDSGNIFYWPEKLFYFFFLMLCHTKHILYNLWSLTLGRVKVKWILGGLFIILQITAWHSAFLHWNMLLALWKSLCMHLSRLISLQLYRLLNILVMCL